MGLLHVLSVHIFRELGENLGEITTRRAYRPSQSCQSIFLGHLLHALLRHVYDHMKKIETRLYRLLLRMHKCIYTRFI